MTISICINITAVSTTCVQSMASVWRHRSSTPDSDLCNINHNKTDYIDVTDKRLDIMDINKQIEY